MRNVSLLVRVQVVDSESLEEKLDLPCDAFERMIPTLVKKVACEAVNACVLQKKLYRENPKEASLLSEAELKTTLWCWKEKLEPTDDIVRLKASNRLDDTSVEVELRLRGGVEVT